MSEDFMRSFDKEIGISKAYTKIDRLLRREGWDILRFSEMDPMTINSESEITDFMRSESLSQGQAQYDQLNSQQKGIVDYILNLLKNDNQTEQQKCVYTDGPDGTGKTFVYSTIYYLLTGQDKIVNTMSYTGMAATLLPNGKTVHKTLGLPVSLFSDSTSNIKLQSKEADHLRYSDVFIWDEAPMAPR